MEEYSKKVMEHFMNPHNVGEIPDADGIGNVGNPVCVVGDTMINVNSSVKTIDRVTKGQKVLSHDGRYNRVIRLFKRSYSGRLHSFKIQSLGELTVTSEHHILAMKMSHLKRGHRSLYKKFIPDWYCAEELKKGDAILYPIPHETKNTYTMEFDIDIPFWDFKSKKLPKKVKITNDFLKLVGYYLSEGYVRVDKCKGTFGFVFGINEREYCEEVVRYVKDIFNIEPTSIYERNNSITVVFYSARLARFFNKHFGKDAIYKHLPHFMLLLPVKKQRYLIETLWKGDGYFRKDGAKFCTISRQLAHQLKLLLMRQKIVFSFLTVPTEGIHKENYHIYLRGFSSLKKLGDILGRKFKCPEKKQNSFKAWYDDKFFYTRIKSVGSKKFSGRVYNLEVENAHSYASEAACLHNCGDIMRLYIKVGKNEKGEEIIKDAKFKTFGCGAAIATSSMITDLVKGKSVKEALEISNRAVAEALDGLPPIKMHCSMLAEEALKSAIEDYLKKKQR